MGFAFAHHFASHDAIDAMMHYRKRISSRRAGARAAGDPRGRRSSRRTPMRRPSSLPLRSTSTGCAATAASICRCRASRRRWPIPTPTPSAPRSRATARACSSAALATVQQKLQPLIDASKPDELMVITAVYDHDGAEEVVSAAGGGVRAGEAAA